MVNNEHHEHDGYLRVYIDNGDGHPGAHIMGVVTVAPGEVDVALDDEPLRGTRPMSAADELALAYMTSDRLADARIARPGDASRVLALGDRK